MTRHRFFVPIDMTVGSRGTLDQNQSRQLRLVLRRNTGATITVFNGTGIEATARIVVPSGQGTTFEVTHIDTPAREPSLRLSVALAMLKGDRFEVAVQKLTELGVVRIVPLLTERAVVSFDDARAWPKREERYARIIREAAEQSERVRLPEITVPTTLAAVLHQQPAIVLLERSSSEPVGGLVPDSEATLVVGPEGGWSERELAMIATDAVGTASLGPLILRAETAAIVGAAALIQRSWAEAQQQGHGGDRL